MLSPITGEQVFRASARFPLGTATGADCWHPRHFSLMGLPACRVAAAILNGIERWGHLPQLASVLMLVMLPKPDATFRPIGLLPSLMRLWGRVRRTCVRAWENTRGSRPYLWGCRGRSAEMAVWTQAIVKEYSKAVRREAAAVLVDLTKAYELVQHSLAMLRVRESGFPAVIARVALAVYAAERFICIEGWHPRCAGSGRP